MSAKLVVTILFFLSELIAFLLTVIGNLVVIWVMSREKMLRKKSNHYVLSVSFADLLVGLVALPSGVAKVTKTLNLKTCQLFVIF